MKVLLTGFEPFGGRTVNPSERVARALHDHHLPDLDLHTAILPVDHRTGPAALLQHVDQVQPDAVICLGEAGRRARISIERVAINLLDFAIPDNGGLRIHDAPIVPDGPAAYFATLPVRAMYEAVCAAGVPAELSLSAGSFLCNQVSYVLLHQLAITNTPIAAGFVHLPFLPEQAVHESIGVPSMALDTMISGLLAALTVLPHAIETTDHAS